MQAGRAVDAQRCRQARRPASFESVPLTFNAAQQAVENALLAGIKSVPNPPTLFSAEWNSESIATDQSPLGSQMTLNGAYSWSGDVATHVRRAYAHAPTEPAFLLEEPYDEEGPDGNNFNPSATQPVRRFQWKGVLGAVGGYVSGNGSGLSTRGGGDISTRKEPGTWLGFMPSFIAWHTLVPSGLGGMRILVTSGGGSPPNPDYVAAAAAPDGTVLVAYVPPAHSGTITVDMTAMSVSTRARWFDPTTASYTSIGTNLTPSGTRVFTPPGPNGAGDGDWVLLLDRSP
jgi:Putative collagen-binding domain of a collagenase